MAEQTYCSKIISDILDGYSTLEEFEKEVLAHLRVRGKTLDEWSKDLLVKIPSPKESLSVLEDACSKIGTNIQQAEFMLGLFELGATAMEAGAERQFSVRYVTEMQNGGQKLASDKLKHIVSINEDVSAASRPAHTAALVRDFFKRMVHGLEEARKAVEARIQLLRLQR